MKPIEIETIIRKRRIRRTTITRRISIKRQRTTQKTHLPQAGASAPKNKDINSYIVTFWGILIPLVFLTKKRVNYATTVHIVHSWVHYIFSVKTIIYLFWKLIKKINIYIDISEKIQYNIYQDDWASSYLTNKVSTSPKVDTFFYLNFLYKWILTLFFMIVKFFIK